MMRKILGQGSVCAVTVSAAFLVLAAPGTAAAAGYMKLGDIKGEAVDSSHKDEIEILSWSWGETRSATMGAHAGGGGGGAGKVSMADGQQAKRKTKGKVQAEWKVEEGTKAASVPGEAEITLKRGVPADAGPDRAEASLVPASRNAGSLTATVPAGVCRAGARYETAEMGTGEQVYRMEDVLVTACAPIATAQGAMPAESMSLNYTKISF